MRVPAPPQLPRDREAGGPLFLRDGTVAVLRSAGPSDRDRIRRFFHELSPESRRRRFAVSGEPPDAVIARFWAPADPASAVTLLAMRADGGADPDHVIAVATYLRINDRIAEMAFAVHDGFEGKGIATGMLEQLAATAREAGFERFQATTSTDNAAMLEVFRDSGFTIRSKTEQGSVDVELTLQPSAQSVEACREREGQATAESVRPLVEPRAVAVIGASREPSSLGRRVFDALVAGGFDGPIYPVNPHADEIAGRQTYPSARDLPRGVDLAVVAVPRDAVLPVIDDCAAAGVKSVVVITAGFAEVDEAGRRLQRELLARVRRHGMRMIGPNCMGLLNTALHLNASFSPLTPPEGRVALLSQSGALGIAIVALAAERRVGLSTFVSVGNKADVSGNDLLQYWERDPHTGVILLYLESFGNPRRFARLARRIGRQKPIVVVKSGRTRAGSRAAGSHTAALAASDVAVDALLHQTGVIRADTIDEMFDIAACLDTQPLPAGRRVAIVTNAGGPGILAVDACESAGLTVAEFSGATKAALATRLPAAASLGNPVDMVASAGPEQYRHSIEVALAAEETDALLVIYTTIDAAQSPAIVAAIRDAIATARTAGAVHKPVLACLMADHGRPSPLNEGNERIPVYPFPENASRALGKIATYAAWRNQTPGLFWSFNDIHVEEARAVCREAAESRGDTWLTEDERNRVANAIGLPVVPCLLARTAEEAVAVAEVVGYPVVAKINSPRASHKTDVGGVRLNLTSARGVRKAFNEIAAEAAAHGIADAMEGVWVQPMVEGGVETLVGLVDDPLFGPLVGLGLGGTDVEAIRDVHFRVTPLTDRDADELLHEMRGFALLDGFRGRPRADLDALTDVVLRVSRLAEDVPEIQELDLNPVIVLPAGNGCRIVDARIRVSRRPAR